MKTLILTLLTLGAVTSSFAQQSFYDVIPGNGNGIRFGRITLIKYNMGNTAEYLYGPYAFVGVLHQQWSSKNGALISDIIK